MRLLVAQSFVIIFVLALIFIYSGFGHLPEGLEQDEHSYIIASQITADGLDPSSYGIWGLHSSNARRYPISRVLVNEFSRLGKGEVIDGRIASLFLAGLGVVFFAMFCQNLFPGFTTVLIIPLTFLTGYFFAFSSVAYPGFYHFAFITAGFWALSLRGSRRIRVIFAFASGIILGANLFVFHQGYLIAPVAAAFVVSEGLTARAIVERLTVFSLAFVPFAAIAFSGFIDELQVKSYALTTSPLRPDLDFSERLNYLFEYASVNVVRVNNLLFNSKEAVGDHFITMEGVIFPPALILFAVIGLASRWRVKNYRLFSLFSLTIVATQLIIFGVHDPRFFVVPFFILAILGGFGVQFLLNAGSSQIQHLATGITVGFIVLLSVISEREKIHRMFYERNFSKEYQELGELARQVHDAEDTTFLCPVPRRDFDQCYLSACALLIYFEGRTDSIRHHEIDMNNQLDYCESLSIVTPESSVSEQINVLFRWKELEEEIPKGFFLVNNRDYLKFEVYWRRPRYGSNTLGRNFASSIHN